MIGTLASGLAHEIRNPLNALNLNLQLLDEELTPGEQLQLHSLAHGILVSFSGVYSQTEAGRIDETSLARWGLIFNRYPVGGVALLADHWDASKDYLDPEFVRYMEENIVNER